MSLRRTIIGISGTTNSGKSTLAKHLFGLYHNTTHICQDDYFLEPGDERLEWVPEVQHANWDKMNAIDMHRMMKDVLSWIKNADSPNSRLLIVEGFLIFNYSELTKLFDKKYYVKVDYNTCNNRRLKRVYIPADPPGYFEKVVWPMYLVHHEDIKQQSDIHYYSNDNEGDYEKIVNKICTDIEHEQPLLKIKK